VLKFRTANEVKRIDVLRKLGDTDVVILQLPSDMSKNEAAKYVLTNLAASYPDFNTVETTALLEGLIRDENTVAKPKAVKKPKAVAVGKNTVKFTKSVESDEFKIGPKEAGKLRAEFMKQLKAAYEAN
jgi:hypothetical protein